MLEGTINPPRIMEGRNIAWLNNIVDLLFEEITPIKIPRLAMVNAVMTNTKTKYPQFVGIPALNNGPAVNVIITDTRRTCTKLLTTGMVRMERAGTPLILKLRKIPASRASTIGLGKASRAEDIIAIRIMAGIMVGANVGLSPVRSIPNKIYTARGKR